MTKYRVTNKETFIKRSCEIHGDRFGYGDVDYKGNTVKVKIRCQKHGVFEQVPCSHLKGIGCAECSGLKKSNTEDFTKKARKKHGDLFGYDNVHYKNNKTKVKIRCHVHGIFEQRPNCHLLGSGCPECSPSNKSNIDKFIKKARETHGDLFGYDEVDYKKSVSKVKNTLPQTWCF